MDIVYGLPGWLGLILITLVCVVIACGGHVAVHRSFAKTNFIEHNEVAGFVIAVVGVLYAVLLGFITIVVWERFDQSEQRASAEVNAATDILRFGRLLSPPEAKRLRDDVDAYAVSVVNDEWPKMQHGGNSAQVQHLVIALIGDVARIPVTDQQRSNLQNHLFDRVQILADLRRDRISDIKSTVPGVIQVGLLIGACTVIGFLYLFGLENFRVQLLMTAATATIIGVLFGIIILLDYPFRGDVSVSPERWVKLHEIIAEDVHGEAPTDPGR